MTITVTGVNDAPVAAERHGVDDGRDGGQRQRARQRHGCRSGTTLTATLGASPANGTVTLNADGSFTYTPAANFNGTDSFTYTASDGTAVSNVATVTITVTGVNDAPVAVNDTASTTEETAVSGNVLGNDTDVDPGTTLTATLGASPTNGTVTLNADGSFTYTPNANFNGTDSFTYTASDGTAVSNVATVTITVTGVNDAPVAAQRRGVDDGRRPRSAATCSATTRMSIRHDADGHARREPGERHRHAQRRRQLHLHAERELQRDRQLHLHGELTARPSRTSRR